jgi:LPS sulfotransferase NodH
MASRTTIEQTRAPLAVRLLNQGGAALERVGFKSKPLSAAQLIEKAQRRAHPDDFSEPDFFEPLSRLLESCHREARLNVIGKLALRNDVIRILCNRLLLVRDRQRHTAIGNQEIREPVFIVGLPRSGTTLLHTLLAADPAHRVPLTWEVMSPSPADAEDRQRRVREANRDLAMLRWLAPTFESVHATGAELPQECVSLMSPTFMSDQFDTMYNIPSYRAWFFRQDLRPAYAFHRRFLQHLQFHREPVDAVASVSSLVTILRRVFSDAVDPIQVGADAMVYWSEALKTFMRVRDQLPANRVCDLHYAEVRRDPIAATRRVYEHFGWSLGHQAEQQVRVVLNEQNSRSNGEHRYDAKYFGLNGTDAFAEYCERFGFNGFEKIKRDERVEAAA